MADYGNDFVIYIIRDLGWARNGVHSFITNISPRKLIYTANAQM